MILISDVANSPVGYAMLQLLSRRKEHERVRVLETYCGQLCRDDGFVPFAAPFYDQISLGNALQGVDTLFLCSFNLFSDRRSFYVNILHEAAVSGVKKVVFVSSVGNSDSASLPMHENRETEMCIRACGIPYIIFRVNIFMENLPLLIGTNQACGIYYPAGNGRIAFVSVYDVVDAIYPYVAGNVPAENRIFTLSHEITYSFKDIAVNLSQYYARSVRYESISLPFYRAILSRMKIPQDAVDRLCSVAKAVSMNNYDVSDSTMRRILARHAQETQLGQRIRRWFSQKEVTPFLFGGQLTLLPDYLHGMHARL